MRPIRPLAFGLLALVACTDQPTPLAEVGSDETDSSETGETNLLLGEPNIVLHPKQPMVVDVIVELTSPGFGTLVPPDDDVGVVLLSPADGEPATTLHFRVRGLLPAFTHSLSLTVSEADGDRTDQWSGEFTTNEALPGFIAKFEIDTPDPSLVSDDRRLFDLTRLFATEASGLYLVDNEGTTRWYLGDVYEFDDLRDVWGGVKLRADGTVSVLHRSTAYVFDELGETLMELHADDVEAPAGFHHDLAELPNGNFITLGFTFAEVDYPGEGALFVAGDIIYELTPAGDVVWTWNSFDHLDPQRRREGFFDPTQVHDPETEQDGFDWTHGNGLVYTADDDTITLSLRHQDWVLAIDHATGDIRWRLGDEGDFALLGDDQWFFHQHSVQWQADGSIMLYDNAIANPQQADSEAHSRAVRYVLDPDAMTATKVWSDDDPKFVSPVAGDADRLSNGSVLRLDSMFTDADNPDVRSRLHELDPTRTPNLVWSLLMPPDRFTYRAVPVSRWVGEAAP